MQGRSASCRPAPAILDQLDHRSRRFLDRTACDVDHRPVIVSEHAAGISDFGFHAFIVHIGSFGRLVEREQTVAPNLDKAVEAGRQPDDERTLQMIERVGRRRFGNDRNICLLYTSRCV